MPVLNNVCIAPAIGLTRGQSVEPAPVIANAWQYILFWDRHSGIYGGFEGAKQWRFGVVVPGDTEEFIPLPEEGTPVASNP